MNLLSLIGIELQKIRRSKILWILFAATVILWIPSVLNADLNFTIASWGISTAPEYNFFIQGFLGMAWFMFPGSMVVSTVLLIQTERGNHGLLKMLAMPISAKQLCLAKFAVLLCLAFSQVLMMTGMYYVSAVIASHAQNYSFILPPFYVLKETVVISLAAIPMLAFFWMVAVCIQTPIFSVGIGLASIVPSVLAINTKVWYLYPMAYQLYMIANEQGRITENIAYSEFQWFPWIPTAAAITTACLLISCLRFGRAERR